MKKLRITEKAKIIALLGCMVLTPVTNNKIVNATEIETRNETNNNDFDSQELIKQLSKIYSIKEEILYDYIDFRTNGYSDMFDKNVEVTFIKCAKDLYEEARKQGYYDSITTNEEYEVKLSPEQLIEKYSVIGPNKTIAMAIAYTECREPIYEDWNYKTNGNIAGIGGDMHFANAEIGVIYYMFMLRDNYKVNENSDDSILSSMAHIYCPPNAYAWENELARPIYNEIKDDFYARAPKESKPITTGVNYTLRK